MYFNVLLFFCKDGWCGWLLIILWSFCIVFIWWCGLYRGLGFCVGIVDVWNDWGLVCCLGRCLCGWECVIWFVLKSSFCDGFCLFLFGWI